MMVENGNPTEFATEIAPEERQGPGLGQLIERYRQRNDLPLVAVVPVDGIGRQSVSFGDHRRRG
jgi:hypothetical protein